jgi:hypothetical protein
MGEEAQCEGEDGEVVAGQIQPLHQLELDHFVGQAADLVVAQVQGPAQSCLDIHIPLPF